MSWELEVQVLYTGEDAVSNEAKVISLPIDENELHDRLMSLVDDDDDVYDVQDILDKCVVKRVGGLDVQVNQDNLLEVNEYMDKIYHEDNEDLAYVLIEHGSFDDIETVYEKVHYGGDFQYYQDVNGLEDVAENMVEEGLFGDVSDNLKYYIDYEKLGDALTHDGWEYDSDKRIAICFY